MYTAAFRMKIVREFIYLLNGIHPQLDTFANKGEWHGCRANIAESFMTVMYMPALSVVFSTSMMAPFRPEIMTCSTPIEA